MTRGAPEGGSSPGATRPECAAAPPSPRPPSPYAAHLGWRGAPESEGRPGQEGLAQAHVLCSFKAKACRGVVAADHPEDRGYHGKEPQPRTWEAQMEPVSAALGPTGSLDIAPTSPRRRIGGCPGNAHVILSKKEKGCKCARKCVCVCVWYVCECMCLQVCVLA